jgi:DNA-binding LacI/PurR family transcriptional regulator
MAHVDSSLPERYDWGMSTMEDVARRSGLSRVTVSKVLNGRAVRAATRSKVLDACRELNFIPNHHATTLVRNASRLMGLMVTSITDPFYAKIIETAERTATELGYDLTYRCSYANAGQERNIAEAFLGLKAVALIVSPVCSEENAAFWKSLSLGLPVVFIDHATVSPCNLIATDHYAGARLLTEHLLTRNRHPAYLGSTEPLANSAIAARLQGYLDAMSDAGQQANVLPTSLANTEGGDTEQFGYEVVKRYLQSGGANARSLDALACATDAIALGAMAALSEAGLTPGRDVLIAGHDDLPFSSFVSPGLTTVRQPRAAIGEKAVRTAVDLVTAPASARRNRRINITLDPQLIVRTSTLGRAIPAP